MHKKFSKGSWVLELDGNDDFVEAFLFTVDRKYSASLACVEGTGCVEGRDGEKVVPELIIDWAVEIAENNGY